MSENNSNPGAENAGEAAVQVEVKGFDYLSQIQTMDIDTSSDNNGASGDGNKGGSGGDSGSGNDDKGGEVSGGTDGSAEKKGGEEDSFEDITEFKFKDENNEGGDGGAEASAEEKAKKEALANLEADTSWINLAKVRGIELKEDTVEAYNKALDENIASISQSKIEEARKEARNLELDKLPVDAVVIVEGLKEGFTLEEILEPRKEIQRLQALSDADLIAEDCRLKDWPENIIEKHIADLTEKDQLDVAAQPLRDILNSNEKILAQRQLDQIESLKQSRANNELIARKKESEEIKNTLTSMKTFMDVPLNEKVINHIVDKWTKNEYQEAFKDPKKVAEFLVYSEFGEQGIKALKNREFQRGREETAKKLHNVPPVQKTGSKTTGQAVKAEGNFSALPNP